MAQTDPTPNRNNYDVVIVGGAIMGSSVAWFLASNPDFQGRVLVVERDPGYGSCSTAHTNSCMRQQFSAPINVKISQFAADYVKRFREELGDERVPGIHTHFFGYMYLAGDDTFAGHLRRTVSMQAQSGAGTVLLTPDEIAARFPFYRLDDILLGAFGTRDEGYFDGGTMFDWWRRKARERGVEFTANEVVAVERQGDRVTAVQLASGERIACGWVVNAAGPRAARVAAMAGLALPVEPRKRYTWVFEAERPLGQDLPLTIDPGGVHVRSDGGYYMAGATPDHDPAVEPDDFAADHGLWESKVWPALANRIPAFEAIRVVNEWVGHYAYNTLDQNAVLGPDDRVGNFLYANGFSGHGLQQSPAVGRGIAEWIATGGWQTLDLSPLGIGRIRRGERLDEAAII
ncbi:NAD(P)/FAD-dependent oxidoreductase [Sinisalibacter aestuarii]|uniref:Oxidoreductase n=1 Tax=Sinisalibacter aestuarii TaxID=2949426 RepID=A0ABQ5LN31_9RHOB|nr:FAD-binding oxidoreductase [Sinisalibacter aestuarii]GKY86356.1 oxidoreductase [Sinisalibacter aestuarii]